ncbi:MAG: hypothetical protein AAF627_21705 [Myxococcota bacterium]
MTSTSQEERVAIHEAGHALLAVLLGRGVRTVRIRPRPETQTTKKLELPRGLPKTEADQALMEGEIMLLVAGLCAERALGVEAQDSMSGALDDMSRASELALRVAGRSRAETTMAHFLSKVERMLKQRAEVLAETAAALARTGQLDQARVADLVPRR